MSVWHLYTKRQTGWTWGGDARGGRKTEMVAVFEIPAERWAKAAERAMPLSVHGRGGVEPGRSVLLRGDHG